jgi:uncharacterized protein (DUF305 family)
MTRPLPHVLKVLLLSAAATTACAVAPRAATPDDGGAAMRADSLGELDALFRARLAESRTRFTEADVRFMSDMIAHHAQALEMADHAVPRGASPAVRTLAARIRSGQQDEIALMQSWLRERGQPVPEVHAGAGHHGHDHGTVPGMLTPAQLAELGRASGAEFDRLFLIYMIEHHRGAVAMVDTLLASDGAAQDPVVFRLAADVQADQTAEIARMQRMLAAMLSAPGP